MLAHESKVLTALLPGLRAWMYLFSVDSLRGHALVSHEMVIGFGLSARTHSFWHYSGILDSIDAENHHSAIRKLSISYPNSLNLALQE